VAATWPDAAAWLDEIATARLLGAYVRRKRFEAQLLLSVVADALGSTQGGRGDRVTPAEMLGMLGVTL
jgi:hypothetical protein